ncbi:MAG: hypothetical protein P8X51_14015, partial [Maritimibacter sp.]
MTQIAYAKEKLPLVRIAAKVGSEPKVQIFGIAANDCFNLVSVLPIEPKPWIVCTIQILRSLMPLLDPPLTTPPKLKLSRLRDIGWSVWENRNKVEAVIRCDAKYLHLGLVAAIRSVAAYLLEGSQDV